jgi:hypothetical protein
MSKLNLQKLVSEKKKERNLDSRLDAMSIKKMLYDLFIDSKC